MSQPVSISVLPDGPLKLSGVSSMTYCGEPVGCDGDVYVCRCGQSSNPPFCDGTHRKVRFDGSPGGGERKEVVVWEGRTVRTRFDPNVCMHVFLCKPLKALRERELAGDDEAAAEILRVVSACPSSALTFERKADVPAPAAVEGPAVEVMEGGEVRVRGAFTIDVALLDGHDGERATLCRCGQSKNKPWCDGRHKGRKGFR